MHNKILHHFSLFEEGFRDEILVNLASWPVAFSKRGEGNSPGNEAQPACMCLYHLTRGLHVPLPQQSLYETL